MSNETMRQEIKLTRPKMTTPRAAGAAGILFSVLLIISLMLIRLSVPSNPIDAGTWLEKGWKSVNLALNLVPFAGIAFLWFIGVVRDRLGDYEDRFFATVFLGSGLLFLAMLFASAAVTGGLISIFGAAASLQSVNADVYTLGRAITYEFLNVYAWRMAGVFMISTSTVAIRTGILPRWMAILGYALALVLLLSLGYSLWVSLVFPLWIFLISVEILIANFRKTNKANNPQPEANR
jgi:hypothetical protein